jgi:gamma-glutamylcyclotransferase
VSPSTCLLLGSFTSERQWLVRGLIAAGNRGEDAPIVANGLHHEPGTQLWYFAYGSNLHHSIFIELRRMRPLAARWGWLRDFRLCFNIPVGPNERAVANIEPHVGARTCGALYLLSAADCERLDNSEGVGVGLYRRTPVEVISADGECTLAFSYQSSITTIGRRPSPRYMSLLLDGARQHGLPRTWIDFLSRFELAVDERSTESGPGTPAA